MKWKQLKHTYLLYTISFLILLPIIFFPFLAEGRTFVWQVDGINQHYPILVYYGKLLRGLLLGKGLPMVDFSIGMGFDTITTLHYYALGDPIASLAIFMTEDNGPAMYVFLILLRLYLIGISFLLFSRYWRLRADGAILGALIYVFCGYSFFSGVRHPYFLNPMIYLPVLLIGLEQVLRRRKPYLLITMTFLCTASNFYFLYILSVMAVIYVTLRYMARYHREEQNKIVGFILTGLRTGGWYLLGMALAAGIFVPVIYAFLQNGRMDSKPELLTSYFHYNRDYYFYALQGFFASGVSPHYWVDLSFPVIVGISVVIVLCGAKFKPLAITFILTLMALLVPFFGYMMNGFSYITNRWDFLVAFVVAVVFTTGYERLCLLDRKEKLLSVAGILGYSVLAFIGPSLRVVKCIFLLLVLTFVVLLLLQSDKLRERKGLQNALIYLLVMGNLAFNGYAFFSMQFNGYAEEFLTKSQVNQLTDNGEELLSSVPDDSFYRIETYGDKVRNEALLSGYNDVSAYYSLMDGNVTNYYKQLELISQRSAYRIDNQDNRTILDALAGVKYFITTDKNAAPYAYELKEVKTLQSKDYYLLENLFALPLGYTYRAYMTEEDYQKLSALEKQNALLYSAVLEKPSDNVEPTGQDMGIGITKLDYKISAARGIVLRDRSIEVRKAGASMTLSFEGDTKAETYVRFENLRLDKRAMLIQTFKVKGDREPTKKVNVRNRYHNTYFGKKNYLVNNGYGKAQKSLSTITFPEPMIYNYDELEVYSLSMEHVKEQLHELGKNTLHNTKVSNNRIEGDAELNENGIMVFSIPYSKGWSAVVNGERAELKKANIMYSALELSAGTHHIVLTYQTPYLREGLLLSASSAIILISVIFYQRRKEAANV